MATFDEQYAAALDSASATLAGGAPQQGMRRRSINWAEEGLPTAPVASDADAESRATLTRFGGRLDSLRGIGNALVGDQDEANALYARVREREARADAMDSDVSTNFKDWNSVGDAFAGVRKMAIQSAPDMALALGGAGMGRTIARRAATGAEARALAQAPTRALEDAAAARMARQRVQAATPEVAALQRQEALQQAARGAVRSDPTAMARVNRVGRAGALAGGVAGGLPGQIAEQREALEENPGQTNAAKLLAASTGAAALDYLPLDRLMGRAFKNPALKQAFADANPSLVRQLGRRAATAAKGVGGQTLTEGLTEGAQAAIQRAGHKWVDNNVQLLSREALDDYVANAVGGALLGGAMGAAVDVPQGVAGATADTGRWAWDRSGAARAKIRENLAKPWFRGQDGRPTPGAPMGPSGGPQPPSDGAPGSGEGTAAADLLQRVKDGLRSMQRVNDGLRSAGAQAQDLAGRVRSAAAEGLQRTADALKTNRDLDAQADAVMDDLTSAMNAEDGGIPLGPNHPVHRGTTLTSKLMWTRMDPAYAVALDDHTAARLNKIFDDIGAGTPLSRPQLSTLMTLVNDPASGVDQKQIDFLRGAGPALKDLAAPLSRGVKEPATRHPLAEGGLGDDNTLDATLGDPARDATKLSEDQREGRSLSDGTRLDLIEGLNETTTAQMGRSAESRTQREDSFERMADRRAALQAVVDKPFVRPVDMPTGTPEEKRAAFAAQKKQAREARTELAELSQAMRSEVLGSPTPANPRGAHVFSENRSEKGKAAWERAQTDPNYVALGETYEYGTGPNRQRGMMLNLAHAVHAQMSNQGANLPEGFQERGAAALAAVFKNAQMAGIELKPESLKPGRIQLDADPARGRPKPVPLLDLTPELISSLQSARTSPIRVSEQPVSRGGRRSHADRRAAKELGYSLAQYDVHKALTEESGGQAPSRAEVDAELRRRSAEAGRSLTPASTQAQGHNESAFLPEQDRTLTPRNAPQGAKARDVGNQKAGANEYVPEASALVSDISTPRRFGALVDHMRRYLRGSRSLDMARSLANKTFRNSAEGSKMRARLSALGETVWKAHFALDAVERAKLDLERAASATSADRKKAADAARKAAYDRAYDASIRHTMDQLSKVDSGTESAVEDVLKTEGGLAAAGEFRSLLFDMRQAEVEGDTYRMGQAREGMQVLLASSKDAATLLRAHKLDMNDRRIMNELARERAEEAGQRASEALGRSAVPTRLQAQRALDKAEAALAKLQTPEVMAQIQEYWDTRNEYENWGHNNNPNYSAEDIVRAAGKKDLDEQRRSGEITDHAYQKAIKELEDPASETSLLYAAIIENGDGTRVTHAKADDDSPAFNTNDRTTNAIEKRLQGVFGEKWRKAAAEWLVHAAEGTIRPAAMSGTLRGALVALGQYVDGINPKYRDSDGVATAYDDWLDSQIRDAKPDSVVASKNKRDEKAKALKTGRKRERAGVAPEASSHSTADEANAAKAEGRDPKLGAASPTSLDRAIKVSQTKPQRNAKGGVVAPINEEKDSAPAPRKRKTVIKNVPKSEAAVDAGVAAAVDVVAQAEPAAHDHKAAGGLVNALLKALGYSGEQYGTYSVGSTTTNTVAGDHNYKAMLIRISDALTGRERIEVLAHEIGHAVIAAEISRATGIPVKDLRNPDGSYIGPADWMSELKTVNPKLYAALQADYAAWKQKYGSPIASFTDMRLSRSPAARGARLRRDTRVVGRADVKTGDLSGYSYQVSMNEWLADNIARALLQNKTGQATTEKFFSKIAAQLKRAYDLLFKGKQAKRWAPAPSVEAWIGGLFDANVAAVRQVEGQTASKATADAAVAAATHSAAHPPGSPPPPPPPRGDGGAAQPQGAPDEFNALRAYINAFLPPDARQTLERAFSTAAADKLIRSTFEGLPEVTDLLSHASEGMDARIAAGYIAWRIGAFKGGPQSQSALRGTFDGLMNLFNLAGQGDYAQRILQDMYTGRVKAQREIRGGYSVRTLEAKARGNLQRALNQVVDVKDKVLDPFNRAMESNAQRMFESGIPAARKIAAMLYKPQGYTGNDRGMLRDVVHQTSLFADQAARIFNGLTARQQRNVVNLLQRKATEADLNAMLEVPGQPPKPRYSEKTKQAVRDTRRLMADSLKYMREAGVNVREIDAFFPVVMDISGEFDAQKLTTMLSQPHLERAIRELEIFQERDKNGNTRPSSKPIAELVQDLVNGAASSPGPATTGSGVPNFTGANMRTMNFIYTKGTPADIKTFASLQSKNPAEIFARYFEPMVKRAEYARRFGDDGKKLEALLEQMKEQGATDAQVAHARDAVASALGTYGQDLSPVLKQISPGLANRFSGDKTRATIDGLTAYQNARLLPLSLLTSLVDPAGIMVRAGGDAGIAWRGFRNGLRTLYSKSSREQLQDMLRLLGATSDMGTVEHLNQMFGGAGSKFSQKVNEMVFKWNGMSAWVRATRYMALNASHEFLLKHARGADEHSARYLAELGVKAEDIQTEFTTMADGQQRALVKLLTPEQRAAADKAEVDRDDRVRKALMEFIDGAILRPNTQQVPLWHNDPFMRLVTQYKSFGYAFYDQIMRRINVEMRNGNHKVLLAAAAYMPVVIMAEMLRNWVQGDEEDTEDWGPYEWVQLGAERSGFVPPKLDLVTDTIEDVQRNRLPGSSNIGPTPSQARNVAKALQGQRDLGKEFESALPGSALYRKWNDESRGAGT